MSWDLYLLLQTILYFAAAISGTIAAITLGVTERNFGRQCILYGRVGEHDKEKDLTYFTYGPTSNCTYSVTILVLLGILYPVVIGGLYSFFQHRGRSDHKVWFGMWVLPVIVVDGCVAFLILIEACIITVGLSSWCQQWTAVQKALLHKYIKQDISIQCSAIQNMKFVMGDIDGSSFYDDLMTCQIASWICFIIFAVQLLLSVLRMRRNRLSKHLQSHPEYTVN